MPSILIEVETSPCPNCIEGQLRMPPAENMTWWPVNYTVNISLMCWSCAWQVPVLLEPDGRVHEEGTP
jgi:hypothetical protein